MSHNVNKKHIAIELVFLSLNMRMSIFVSEQFNFNLINEDFNFLSLSSLILSAFLILIPFFQFSSAFLTLHQIRTRSSNVIQIRTKSSKGNKYDLISGRQTDIMTERQKYKT